MSDKKIIIFALIASVVLVVAGWVWTKNKSAPGPGAISAPQEEKIAGISLGQENAPVTIEEYTNFLCPACANFALQTLPKIEENYIKNGKIKMVFFIVGPQEISQAAFCADKAGKFMEYHDYLFNRQGEITQEKDILDFASKVGIEMSQFNQCYSSGPASQAAQSWIAQTQERGVEATPTFIINGEKLVGSQPFEEFQKIIDAKLK